MWLKNFYNAMLGVYIGPTAYNALPYSSFDFNTCAIKRMDGNLYSGTYSQDHISGTGSASYPPPFGYYFFSYIKPKSGESYLENTSVQMVFSSDTAEPTIDDYKFSSLLTNLTFGASSIITNAFTNTVITTNLSIIITNNNSTAVTINSIGLMGGSNSNYFVQNFSNNKATLYYKEKLTTPITIPAGESITYVQSFSLPWYTPQVSQEAHYGIPK